MIDGHGRKINYLRLSITDRCNLRCHYCMPEEGVEKINHEDILSFEEIDEIVGSLVHLGIDKIRLTGGEPLVRNGILTLLKMIKKHSQIKDIALTTNGILLPSMAEALKAAGLDRINISIDSLDSKKYHEMTRGGALSDVLLGIEAAKRVGLGPIKLNVVLINGFNDDEIVDFVQFTKTHEVDVRFIELMPIGEVSGWATEKYLPNTTVLERVPELVAVESSDKTSPAKYYQLPNAKGKVGLISPISCSFCGNCNRLRLTSEGMLKYCLHSNEEFDLKKALDQKLDLETFIQECISKKPLQHDIGNAQIVKRNMVQVGG